jgi:protein-tyrosine kinase
MSRVHEALRRAGDNPPEAAPPVEARPLPNGRGSEASEPRPVGSGLSGAVSHLAAARSVPYRPAPESHLLDLENSLETPAEEFRTLRTRLNHLQTQQPLHSLVITSPSPAEGKTFTAVNLAIAQSQLSEHAVLLGDFDLRRPVIHNLLQIDRAPGLTDYLLGRCAWGEALLRIEGLNLFVLPAGTAVKNPLEILNTRQARALFEELPRAFNWAIFDTPPLLFSADANLLATLADATILVVRIGSTTFDNVTRAMQSLCENNVLGIVANGARAAELYSKYTYYYSKTE